MTAYLLASAAGLVAGFGLCSAVLWARATYNDVVRPR
jgi:hypothetical protein